MTVKIQILSGCQQGMSLRFDGPRILVGDTLAADLRFDPDREAGARGKQAVLVMDEGGWWLSNEGVGLWLVNQTPVDPFHSQRLRSDDVVRVSEMGPDFSFQIIAAQQGNTFGPSAGHGDAATPQFSAAAGEAWRASQATAAPENGAIRQAAEQAGAAGSDAPWSAAVAENPAGYTPGSDEPGVRPSPSQEKRRKRPVNPAGRVIGIVIAGGLGAICAYGIACWVGGEKNDRFHVFYKEKSEQNQQDDAPPTPPAAGENPNR